MAAPVVQTLPELMAELSQANAPVLAVNAQRKAGLADKYAGQRAGLDAAKVQGFNQINDQATGRGASFSGIPIDEQATYLSTKYLPGMQDINAQQNNEGLTLDEQAAQTQRDIATGAITRRDQQVTSLNSWNNQQDQNAFSASEAEKARQFDAAQAAQTRAATQAAQGPSTQDIVSHMNAWTHGKTGKADGKLSPTDFKRGYQEFFGYTGGSYDDYLALMRGYINDSHIQDYIDG
jgi:hypothetical protein